MRTTILAIVLVGFWLALSGHYTPFLLSIGAAAIVLTLLAADRMGVIDSEGQPTQLIVGAITYIPWLLWEIVKSAWTVTKVILHPSLPISPTITAVTASQRTNAGLVVYANSITLTPGTITMEVSGNALTVHAIVSEGADDLEAGGMDRRVTQFERSA